MRSAANLRRFSEIHHDQTHLASPLIMPRAVVYPDITATIDITGIFAPIRLSNLTIGRGKGIAKRAHQHINGSSVSSGSSITPSKIKKYTTSIYSYTELPDSPAQLEEKQLPN